MRLNSPRLTGPLALLALSIGGSACRNASQDVTSNDALQRDLELAQASTVALAQSARDLPATRFVSALEAGERTAAGTSAAPRRARRSPTRAPHAHPEPAPPAPAPALAETQTVAQAATGEQETVVAAPAAVSAPAEEDASIRSENPTVGGPSGDGIINVPADGGEGSGTTITRRGRGGGLGGTIGGIIGVVIRGGAVVGDDDCERDYPGGRRGGIPVGGFPGGMTATFPARGGTFGVPAGGMGRMGRPRM